MVCEELLDLSQVVERVITAHHQENIGIAHIQHGEDAKPEGKDKKNGNKPDNKIITTVFEI
jgi:hypothetical protein